MPDPDKDKAEAESKAKDELKKAVDAAVAEATQKLEAKNRELLDEKRTVSAKNKELTEIFDRLGGSDGLTRLQQMSESLEKTELGKLLKEGKHDEWFDQRTKALRVDHQKQLDRLNEEFKKVVGERDGISDLLRRKVLETAVRASCTAAGVVDTAVEDVLLRAGTVFKHDGEKGLVIHDTDGGTVLSKDGKTPKSVGEWLEEQKSVARHWFPSSKGGDASGNVGGGRSGSKEVDLSNIKSQEEWIEARKKLGIGTGTGIL